MSRPTTSDVLGVLRGLRLVLGNSVKLQEEQCQKIWQNSSVKSAAVDANNLLVTKLGTLTQSNPAQIEKLVTETLQRSAMVVEGLKGVAKFSNYPVKEETSEEVDINELELEFDKETMYEDVENLFRKQEKESSDNSKKMQPLKYPKKMKSNLKVSEIVNDNSKLPDVSQHTDLSHIQRSLKENNIIEELNTPTKVLKEIDIGTISKIQSSYEIEKPSITNTVGDNTARMDHMHSPTNTIPTPVAKKAPKKRPSLSETARQRSVPSSRIGRMVSFGSLAAGLGVGTLAEVTRRSLGFAEAPTVSTTLDSAFLSPANAERIVNTLCKVRGAALKIGQILSIQDNNVISPQLQKAFERVRQSADFMPSWQVEKVMVRELGPDWRSKLSTFEMKPFAAASIGQVHAATLHDGTEVAMKIQYPGVAKGIESDIDNLVSILKVWNMFPAGMFIDNVVEVAKRELSWEVDYLREAECTKKFQDLLKPYPEYYIPRIIDELSSSQVITSEMIEGVPVDKCQDMDDVTRKHICSLVMQLCLRELFQFRYMQTDPNWSNFFYNVDSRQLVLLDFGASRSYDKQFMDQYIQVIKAAADGDKERVLELSRNMGFLTGYESKVMEDAHTDAIMILGEVFLQHVGEFDFGAQNTTRRIQQLVPTIISHRLCPPPEEIYSLHRKLSGVFLLCAKLRVKMNCRDMFLEVYNNYQFS